jgi:hypothetical protein
MYKTKNGYKITLNEYDNVITVRKDNKLIGKETFSDYIKASIAYNNL